MAQVIPAEVELVWEEARQRPTVFVALLVKRPALAATWRLELCAHCSQKAREIVAGLLPPEKRSALGCSATWHNQARCVRPPGHLGMHERPDGGLFFG